MEPRMLDKINDLKRLRDEARLANLKSDEVKKFVLSECKEFLERAELSVNELADYMIINSINTPF